MISDRYDSCVNQVKNKIFNVAGETITETLVALLISALALTMLAGAVSAAKNIVERSRDKVNNYYAKNEELVKKAENPDENANLQVKEGTPETGTVRFNIPVSYYKNDILKDEVVAYKYRK